MRLRNTLCSIFFWIIMQSIVWADTPRATILLYHGLTEKCPIDMYEKRKDRFYRDMEYIRDNFNVISLLELHDIIENQKTLSRNTVVIAFDDGLKSDYTIAAPILKEFGFPATFFIVTDWREDKDYTSWEQIVELSKVTKDGEYLFTIGSHSCSHRYPGLQNLTGAALRHELEDSKIRIDQHIAPRVCETFAVPYGILPPNQTEFRNLATELGYKIIRTSRTRNIDIATDQLLNLPCLPLYDFTEPEYIGAFNESPTPIYSTFFEPAQDVFSDNNQLLSYDVPIKESDEAPWTNKQYVTFEAIPENNDLVQSIEIIHEAPWDVATIRITVKEGVSGQAKINIKVTEQGAFPGGGYFYVNIEAPTVILYTKELHNEPIVIFPNPATDRIEIKDMDETVLYKIYNSSGSLVLAGKGNKIDISAFQRGIYILTIYFDNEELTTLKFVKN